MLNQYVRGDAAGRDIPGGNARMIDGMTPIEMLLPPERL